MAKNHSEIATSVDRDLVIFRERIKSTLRERGLTGRGLEEKLKLATGVLSKIYSGRIKLSSRLLGQIAGGLGVDPLQLVADTDLESLLTTAVDEPHHGIALEVAERLGELERLLAARDAQLAQAALDNAELRQELAAAQAQADAATRKAAQLTNQVEGAKQEVQQVQKDLVLERTRLTQEAQILRRTKELLTAARAEKEEAVCQVKQWQGYALERDARAKQVEAYAAKLNSALAGAKSDRVASVVGASALSFLIGAAVASSGKKG